MNFKCPKCYRHYYLSDHDLSPPKILSSGEKGWRILCAQCSYEWEEIIKPLPLKKSISSPSTLDTSLIRKNKNTKERSEKFIKTKGYPLKEYPKEENPLLEKKGYSNFIDRYFWKIFTVLTISITFGILWIYQKQRNFPIKKLLSNSYRSSLEFIKANDIRYVTHLLADGKKRVVVIGNLINTSAYSLPLKPLKINISFKKTDTQEIFQSIWVYNWSQSHIAPQEKLAFQSERILPKELEVSKIEVNIF